jgi:hypothetical protein
MFDNQRVHVHLNTYPKSPMVEFGGVSCSCQGDQCKATQTAEHGLRSKGHSRNVGSLPNQETAHARYPPGLSKVVGPFPCEVGDAAWYFFFRLKPLNSHFNIGQMMISHGIWGVLYFQLNPNY